MDGSASDFEFDVAFSLSDDDLPTAKKLKAKLGELSLKVFLYSDQQKDLAGSEGVESFSAIYRTKARVVVILHSKKWNATKWTSVECLAIKNRGFDGNSRYDFLLVVPMDDSKPPDWVGPTVILLNMKTLGLAETAGIIAHKAKEQGGELKKVGFKEFGAAAAETLRFQERWNEYFGDTGKGRSDAKASAEETSRELKDLTEQLVSQGLRFEYYPTTRGSGGSGEGAAMGHFHSISFFTKIAPSPPFLPALHVTLWRGPSSQLDGHLREGGKHLMTWSFSFDLTPEGAGWVPQGYDEPVRTARQLAEWMLERLVAEAMEGTGVTGAAD